MLGRGDALSRLASAGWRETHDGNFQFGGADIHQPSLVAAPRGMPEVTERSRGVPVLVVASTSDPLDDPNPPHTSVYFFDSVEEMVEFALEIQEDFEVIGCDLDVAEAHAAEDDAEINRLLSAVGGVPAAQAVAVGWHDYAHALLVATGAMRLACGAGAYPHYLSALSDQDMVAAAGHASRWALRQLREALVLCDSEDILDTVAVAAVEILAHQIASECDSTHLSDAVTAPWHHRSAKSVVSPEVFVAALAEVAEAHPRPPLSPAQAVAVIKAVSDSKLTHRCVDDEPDQGADSDPRDCAACEVEKPYSEAINACLRWHTQSPSNTPSAGRAGSIPPRRQAKLLAEAAFEFSHIPTLLNQAQRRIAGGARAAANNEYLPGVELTLEDVATACVGIISAGWGFLERWLGMYTELFSTQAAAAVVRASGNLWHSELVSAHDQTLLDRLQSQFGWTSEQAAKATARMRATAHATSWDISETIRSSYGIKAKSRRR